MPFAYASEKHRKHALGDGIRTRGLFGWIRTEVLHHVELHPKHARLVRTPRVELGWDAYKTSWLHRSRVRIRRPPASRTQRELLIRKLRATGPS